jgi:hypothetical protein
MLSLSDRVLKDLTIISATLVFSFLLFSTFDVLEIIVDFSQRHEEYEIDELLSTLIVFAICLVLFSWRRIKETDSARLSIEQKNSELQQALNDVKTLQGVLPVCSYCNKIRDDHGTWNDLQSYINDNLDAEFSHGACPDCFDIRMKELKESELEGQTLN